jgi:nicotinic acid mononucleotide adenylyltransferase
MTYNLFIGRYQSPHKGHMHIFNTFLNNNKPVLIAIRDIEPDAANPLTATQVQTLWQKVYENNSLVKVIIIPDIASVNYGRGVGYEVNEIKVDASIANISATEIRKQILSEQDDWKTFVDEKIHTLLSSYLNQKEV